MDGAGFTAQLEEIAEFYRIPRQSVVYCAKDYNDRNNSVRGYLADYREKISSVFSSMRLLTAIGSLFT